jgi:hypothetical protein
LKRVVAEHELDTNVKLSHLVTGAWWEGEADKGRWKVKIQPADDPDAAFFDYAEVVINATGVLKQVEHHTPYTPRTLTLFIANGNGQPFLALRNSRTRHVSLPMLFFFPWLRFWTNNMACQRGQTPGHLPALANMGYGRVCLQVRNRRGWFNKP